MWVINHLVTNTDHRANLAPKSICQILQTNSKMIFLPNRMHPVHWVLGCALHLQSGYSHCLINVKTP